MLDAINALFSYSFLTRALIGGGIIALCASLLGVCLVLKNYSMIGDGLSHVGFGAVAVASAIGISPMPFAIPVVIVCAFLLLRIKNSGRIKGDSWVALISSASLAIGVVAVSLKGGINTDFYSYMFGSILGMSKSDYVLCFAVCIPVILLFLLFYNRIFALTFDETYLRASGLKAGVFNSVIAVLVAVTVVLGMRIMGALLISSLVIFPALTSMRVFSNFKAVTISCAILSVVCFASGIVLSVMFDLPTGACVVCVNAIFFLAFSLVSKIKAK